MRIHHVHTCSAHICTCTHTHVIRLLRICVHWHSYSMEWTYMWTCQNSAHFKFIPYTHTCTHTHTIWGPQTNRAVSGHTQAMVLLLLCWRPTSLSHGSMGTSVHGYTGADSLKWCNSYRQKGVIWSGHHYLGNVHQPGIKRAPADETACRSGHSRNMTESVWIKRCWYH